MNYEIWINGKRRDSKYESRDAANAAAADTRGNNDKMVVVVCVEGAGKLDDKGHTVIVNRDMDRGRLPAQHVDPTPAPAPQRK